MGYPWTMLMLTVQKEGFMPLKLNVGLSKKIGQPDFGSLGASCHVEVELESSLLQTDLNAFQERAQRAFIACCQAVNDELARHRGNDHGRDVQRQGPARAANENAGRDHPGNGHSAGGNGASKGSPNHRASAKQLGFAEKLADEIEGLGTRRLETLARKMYGKPLTGLSSLDASGLLDTLKAIKAGDIHLDVALNGAAAWGPDFWTRRRSRIDRPTSGPTSHRAG